MHSGIFTAADVCLRCVNPQSLCSRQQQDSDVALQQARQLSAQATQQLAEAAAQREEGERRLAAAQEQEVAAGALVAAAEARAKAAEDEAARRGLCLCCWFGAC